jgi:hypothetical protein
LAHSASAQEPSGLTERLVERGGWTVPIFSVVDSKTRLSTKIIDGIKVKIKKHDLTEEQLVKIEDCSPAYQSQFFAVKNYVSYEANGYDFAYSIFFDFVYLEDGVIATRAAASLGRFYVDEDGDGAFELKCNAKGIEKLPGWLKSTAQ